MAKKKSFSIGLSLTQALGDTVSAAKNYSGELNVEVIPLRKIELDPENPRDLDLTFADIYQNSEPYNTLSSRKKEEILTLTSLAKSIENQGVINPIVVYKNGEHYRLIAGERRALASVLAKKEDIQAKVLDKKPDELKLSLLQWIENIEREDLTLWERLSNLEKILKASITDPNDIKKITATTLGELIHCSLQHASNYKSVLGGTEKLLEYIKDNKIKNLEKAATIAKAPIEFQGKLISECLKGATLKELKTLANKKVVTQQIDNNERRGRQLTRVNFGATENINVAKCIIESILQNEKYKHLNKEVSITNWDDFKAVTSAFKLIIRSIESVEV